MSAGETVTVSREGRGRGKVRRMKSGVSRQGIRRAASENRGTKMKERKGGEEQARRVKKKYRVEGRATEIRKGKKGADREMQ